MDTSRLIDLFFDYLPDFFKRKLSSKENYHFASMTNISHQNEEHMIYDTDGYLLFMQTAQSNLSLFNISYDSLIFEENEIMKTKSNHSMKHSNSSFNLQYDIKKSQYRSTILFNDDIFILNNQPLQRWQALDLLNTYA